ncbi:MAG: type I restriction enzyme HsdR N-terminal domain-containing protein [Bernardetiaceae bacterium]|nr:type I restriction enzyme HsdR N-terminal domain-containing protein [Bernardetiaceae bacterium]
MKELTAGERRALIAQGLKERLIRFEGVGSEKVVHYLHQNRRFPFTPEEEVRVEMYLRLVINMKYPPLRIVFEYDVKMGSSYRYVDIAILADDVSRKVFMVVECKRADASKKVFQEAVKQAQSYDRQLVAKYIWVSSGKRNAYFHSTTSRSGERNYFDIDSVPPYSRSGWNSIKEKAFLVRHGFKKFYLRYVRPQLKSDWLLKVALITGLLLVTAFMLSWVHAKVITPAILQHTRWIQHGKWHFGHLYPIVPIIMSFTVSSVFYKQLFPQDTKYQSVKNTKRKRKRRHKESIFLRYRFFFVSLLIALPSLILSELIFDYESYCQSCCTTSRHCWWSLRHYQYLDESWKLKLYFVPTLAGIPLQAVFFLVLSSIFEAFRRLNQ